MFQKSLPNVKRNIYTVMCEMGNEPNIAARSLANNKKSLRIAVILPDYRQDPYWRQPKEGVEHAAESVRHYGVTVGYYFFPLFEPKGYQASIKAALDTLAGAVLIAPVFLAESQFLLEETTRLCIPKVMINTHPPVPAARYYCSGKHGLLPQSLA